MNAFLGILWDNDGVLVDTEPLYFRAGRETLAEVGIELDRRAYREISLERGASVFELAERAGVPAATVAALKERRDARYAELLSEGVPVRPGIAALLAGLRGRVRMGVVTSSRREHFEIIHARSGLLPCFEFTLVREEYERSKPHPEPYRAGLARLGLPASRVVAIEDTARGLASAAAAGLACIVVPNAFGDGETRYEDALRVAPDVESLGEILRELLGA